MYPAAPAAELQFAWRSFGAGRAPATPLIRLGPLRSTPRPTRYGRRAGRSTSRTRSSSCCGSWPRARAGLHAAALLREVWGYDFYGGTRTVDVHVRRLRAKLGPEHEHLVETVRGVGYRAAELDT